MNKANKANKSNKFNTLEEVVEALKSIDRDAALYLWGNFDEEDFQNGTQDFINTSKVGNPRKYYKDPLDFFLWYLHDEFDWYSLNKQLKQLKQSDTLNKTNLKNYITKDIDFIGCDPVIADALKQNKSILCRVWDGKDFIKKLNIVMYEKSGAYPYITKLSGCYKNAEPIKKTKTELTELRVKDPVSVMRWLIDNRYTIGVSGLYPEHPHDQVFLFEFFECCNLHPPENWPWPELLEEVTVKCESDPFEE